MILNLDQNFRPFSDKKEIEFQSFLFSGGEPHIKIKPDFDVSETVTITHRINSFNDFGLLLLAVDALKRMEVKLINVFIPYFPAARQDRVMIAGEPLSVKIYADILNSLKLNKITVFDAHSEVTSALLDNCEVIPNHDFIAQVLKKIGNDVKLISPDGGALKKIYKVSEYLGGIDVVECSKSRDVKTGKLSGFKVYDDNLQGMDCLIVDDICDGGGTFIGLAEELKKKNAGKLYLAVSHGIFNKGFESMKAFEKIFTTDSFREFDEEIVEILKLKM
ncbi:ribose-phosphate diphosphokinase [uncultured Flavobacterium sp.]|uniref:ribose-phosphate diphosphokinase n=1 Tax=uncultured Flavobacterium sp. TaxID=165435 RepID=UPI0025EBD750|nr:ribose-phosphate diphosphokinase [uncultured Flavobacterium sp.]